MVFTLFGIEKPPVAEEGGVATEGKVASGDAGRLPTPYFCYYGLVSFGGKGWVLTVKPEDYPGTYLHNEAFSP